MLQDNRTAPHLPDWRYAGPSHISNYKRNRRLTAGCLNKLGNLGNDLVDRHVLALARSTVLELNGAILKAALAQNHLIREAHEVVIGKLKARTLIAIVDDDLDTLGTQAINNLLADGSALFLLGIKRNHRDLVRGNGDRPDDTVLVVVLLHDGSKRAGHAHAVATHDKRLLLAVLVHKGGAHGLGILGTQLEDLRDLDAASSRERLAAVRAGIAGNDGDQICPLIDGKVALGAGTGKVIIDLVGTAGPLFGLAQALVADQTNTSGRLTGPIKPLCRPFA